MDGIAEPSSSSSASAFVFASASATAPISTSISTPNSSPIDHVAQGTGPPYEGDDPLNISCGHDKAGCGMFCLFS